MSGATGGCRWMDGKTTFLVHSTQEGRARRPAQTNEGFLQIPIRPHKHMKWIIPHSANPGRPGKTRAKRIFHLAWIVSFPPVFSVQWVWNKAGWLWTSRCSALHVRTLDQVHLHNQTHNSKFLSSNCKGGEEMVKKLQLKTLFIGAVDAPTEILCSFESKD